jgi:hypothetical protein
VAEIDAIKISSSSNSSASTPEIILDNEKHNLNNEENNLNIEKNDLKTTNIYITKLSNNYNDPPGDKDFSKKCHAENPNPNPSTLSSVSTKGDISPVRSHKFIQPPKFEESDFIGV